MMARRPSAIYGITGADAAICGRSKFLFFRIESPDMLEASNRFYKTENN